MKTDPHKFYTGFSWDEIKEIAAALRRSYQPLPEGASAGDDDLYFDYPSYCGLAPKIAQRLTVDQVDVLGEEQPRTADEVAHILAGVRH